MSRYAFPLSPNDQPTIPKGSPRVGGLKMASETSLVGSLGGGGGGATVWSLGGARSWKVGDSTQDPSLVRGSI